MIELRAITEDNFIDAFNLRLAPGQAEYVSHPIRSLAQAYVYRDQCQPFGIYADGKMVGYVMVIYDYDIPEYDIWHMMIDESKQNLGYGSEALNRVIDYIRTKPFGDSDRVALTCNKNNPTARKLYEKKGFSPTGYEDEDEIELAMTVIARHEEACMNWINAFELLCYALTLIFLADIIRKKSREEFWLFVSAAVAGFALELLAVRVTDIYHYSRDFYVSIGFEPYQFPFFGGLMWGGLTVYALRIAKRLKISPLLTALAGGWLIVTMDLFLDVAAIRLDGGFWAWEGREITLDITHHMFMSVIWVNFLGYMFETPAMIFISLRTAEKRKALPVWKQFLASVGIGAAGVAFVGAASGISLLLNRITDEWFACIAFVILWTAVLAIVLRTAFRNRLRLQRPAAWDVPVLIYWLVMYGFCLSALVHLRITADRPAYFIAGVLLGIGTLALGAAEGNREQYDNG